MPIEVPKESKVYTTSYDNFKGVDYTSDATNVWRRRSPDAINMMPDEAGRPYKRKGWEIAVPKEQMTELYATDTGNEAPSELSIRKCYYFELAGKDHLFIFTNIGVFVYVEGEIITYPSLSYDPDLIDSWERAYFFEGNGTSAFYIYGNFKIWKYGYDGVNFEFGETEPYIPSANITVDARHEAGVSLEPINLFSDFIAEEFQNNVYADVTSSSTTVPSGTVTVDETLFLAMRSEPMTYVFTYDGVNSAWTLSGDQVIISNFGIKLIGTPQNGNTITVVVAVQYRISLGRTVNVGVADLLRVYASVSTQFDTEIIVETMATHQTARYCTLITPLSGNSYLQFYAPYTSLVDGEDAIKVIYPRNSVATTPHTVETGTIEVVAE